MFNLVADGEMCTKRGRGKNYTVQDKKTLINILQKYRSIIDSKHPDSTTWRQKRDAWEKVKQEYNPMAQTGHRTTAQLKFLYENIKKRKTLPLNSSEHNKLNCAINETQLLTPKIECSVSTPQLSRQDTEFDIHVNTLRLDDSVDYSWHDDNSNSNMCLEQENDDVKENPVNNANVKNEIIQIQKRKEMLKVDVLEIKKQRALISLEVYKQRSQMELEMMKLDLEAMKKYQG